MPDQEEDQSVNDSWQATAVRLAAKECPPGRSQVKHENIVWNNFCDRFARRSDFDSQLLRYVQPKRKKVS